MHILTRQVEHNFPIIGKNLGFTHVLYKLKYLRHLSRLIAVFAVDRAENRLFITVPIKNIMLHQNQGCTKSSHRRLYII